MRLDFDAGQQIFVGDGQKIPTLCWPEIAWEVGIYLPCKDLGIGDTCVLEKIPNNIKKTVKLLSSRYFGSFSPVADFSAAPPRF